MCRLNSFEYRLFVARPKIIHPEKMSCSMPAMIVAPKRTSGVPIKKTTKKTVVGSELPEPTLAFENMWEDEKEEDGKHAFVRLGQPITMFRETGLRLAMYEVDLLDTSSKQGKQSEEKDDVSSDDDDIDVGESTEEDEEETKDDDSKEIKVVEENDGGEENRKEATAMLLAMNGDNTWDQVSSAKRFFTAFPLRLPNIFLTDPEEKRIALRFDLPQGMSQAHLANWVSSQGHTSLALPGPKTCGISSQLSLDKTRRFHAALLGARILSAQNTTDVSFCAKLSSTDPKQRELVSHSNPAGIMGCPPGCCENGKCVENSGMCPILSSGHSAGPIEPESLARLYTLAGKAKDAFNSPDAVRLAHITDENVDIEVTKFLSEDGVTMRIPMPSTEEEALFPDSVAVDLAINYHAQMQALATHLGAPLSIKKSKKGGRKSVYITVEVYRSLVAWLKKFTCPSQYSVNLAGPMSMSLEPLDGQHGWHAMRSQGLLDCAQSKRASAALSVTLEVCLLMLPRGFEGPPMTDNHLEQLVEEDIQYREALGLAVHTSLARQVDPTRRALTKEQLRDQ